VRTGYEQNGLSLTGNVQVSLGNVNERPISIHVEDNSYGTGAIARQLDAGQKASIVLDLKRSHGWYDFSVRTENALPVWRFAGRVETGRSSFSDPLIGNNTDT
jgi:phospholipase C